ncbi:MAG: hypothetical protein PHY46_03790 [Candidatus Omnitrophica bacterium]|nr:hypothetical protein [Candidatus Omnitrophota bacterium]MDD5355662.1 hypothetical protein [Candidatus Omnitrophota bacterium]
MTKMNYRSLALSALLIVMIFAAGCETLKGAAQGFKRDWNKLMEWNEQSQDVAW